MSYANRARQSGRDNDFLQIARRQAPLCRAKSLGSCLFFLVALRFELCELLWSKDALNILHELGLGCFGASRFVMFGHRRFHLRLLICCQVETRKRDRAGHFFFVPSLLCAIAVFTREHCSRCECARRYQRNEFGHSGS